MSIYENFDISLPHSTKGQREQGTQVEDVTQALPHEKESFIHDLTLQQAVLCKVLYGYNIQRVA